MHTQDTGHVEYVSRDLPDGTELPDWDYATPFEIIALDIDVVDRELCPKYILESNRILENVIKKAVVLRDKAVDVSTPGRLDGIHCFIPLSILGKLRAHIKEVFA